MKRPVLLAVVALLVAASVPLSRESVAQQTEKKKAAAASSATSLQVPRSLDELYPPVSPQPVYLIKMHELNRYLNGIIVDLFENDLENARMNFERFESAYAKTQSLVPEWKRDFPVKPLKELGAALASGDPGQTMKAVEAIGRVCSDCHQGTMADVQHKYHWQDIRSVIVTDPLTKKDMAFAEFKQLLNAAFTGVAVDAEQGQTENARRQFQGFRARFQALSEICETCHDTEREYYVDAKVRSLIDGLGTTLESPEINMQKIGELSEKIGTESCFKCHLVHVPAALAKARWEKEERR